MWVKKKATTKPKSHGHFDTLISSKTQLEGDLTFSGGLHVDGRIKGTIRAADNSDAVVRISDVGEVDGDVIAPHIIINGTVHGDVHSSQHIELAANASIKGDVYYHLIEMVMGAEVNGNLVHHKSPVAVESAKSELPEPASLQPKATKAEKLAVPVATMTQVKEKEITSAPQINESEKNKTPNVNYDKSAILNN
ncbi:MAG: polymer-forming cytoskeletal protein [Hahellaceae bacterium]|nr:polymer-forming cytoskeletal protein [Hahellaceae bacterium]MCP5168518.1 polymer-forming cytoskeletal protein [Hahellaceae bacterium]